MHKLISRFRFRFLLCKTGAAAAVAEKKQNHKFVIK